MEDNTTEMTTRRFINADRAAVFAGWTDPEILRIWWGPQGGTHESILVEPWTGGKHEIVMGMPSSGAVFRIAGIVEECLAPTVFAVRYQTQTMAGEPLLEGTFRVKFSEENGGTMQELYNRTTHLVPVEPDRRAGTAAGWNQSIDRLAAYLEVRADTIGK